jgi:Tol biopolymer transport system component
MMRFTRSSISRRAVTPAAALLLLAACGGGSTSEPSSETRPYRIVLFASGVPPEPDQVLFTAEADGSDRRRIWEHDAFNVAVGFAGARPGYPQVMLERQGPSDTRYFLLDIDTGVADSLDRSTVFAVGPVWSPDGTRIAWLRPGELNGGTTVGITGPRGGTPVPVKDVGITEECSSPRWSQTSQQLLFLCNQRLWRVNADGSGLAVLPLPAGATAVGPAEWSPDSRRIVFACAPLGLCTSDPDETNVQVIESRLPAGFRWRPSERIAYWFAASSGWPQGLITVLPDGSAPVQVTDDIGNPRMEWAPDAALLLALRQDTVKSGRADGSRWWPIAPRTEGAFVVMGYTWVDRGS